VLVCFCVVLSELAKELESKTNEVQDDQVCVNILMAVMCMSVFIYIFLHLF